jgi:ribokinase
LQRGKLIASDVHAISDLNDPYSRDFMSYAHILFMSHENLPTSSPKIFWLSLYQVLFQEKSPCS